MIVLYDCMREEFSFIRLTETPGDIFSINIKQVASQEKFKREKRR